MTLCFILTICYFLSYLFYLYLYLLFIILFYFVISFYSLLFLFNLTFSLLIRVLEGEQHDYFEDEIVDSLRHTKAGMVSMANKGKDKNGSQFFITTKEDLHSLDGTNTIFGEVVEGMDVVMKINNTVLDEHSRPLKNIRILHTVIIDDPFDDPPMLPEMPSPQPDVFAAIVHISHSICS